MKQKEEKKVQVLRPQSVRNDQVQYMKVLKSVCVCVCVSHR